MVRTSNPSFDAVVTNKCPDPQAQQGGRPRRWVANQARRYGPAKGLLRGDQVEDLDRCIENVFGNYHCEPWFVKSHSSIIVHVPGANLHLSNRHDYLQLKYLFCLISLI